MQVVVYILTITCIGDEMGVVLAVELGATKVRVAKVHFEGSGELSIIKELTRPISDEYKTSDKGSLFGFIAQCIKDIEPESQIKVGFTFSYPCSLSSRKSGRLLEWTKDINVSGCIEKDPVQLLQQELTKIGVNARIVSMCNDSVSTLVAYSYTHSETAVGVILGSGTNAAYVERVSNISKLKSELTSTNMIVNMEWGNLGSQDVSILPRSWIDEEIDLCSTNPGKQYLEKLMSGLFLGELVRLWITHLRKEGLLLNDVPLSNRLFNERMCFDSSFCSNILLDDSEEFVEIESILQSFTINRSTVKDRAVIREIVDLVITRSARLMGTCLYTVLSHMMDNGLSGCIGVDGSVYKFVPGYKSRMLKAMQELGMEGVECGIAHNGSLIGSALIAYSSSIQFV